MEKSKVLDESLAKLKEYSATHKVDSIASALQALHDLRVPKNFLSQTGGLSGNPVVSSIAQICNVNVDKIQQDIQQLSKGQTTEVGTLESYKNDLKKL